MGPSGSGKTSLLSIIGGRAPARVGLAGQVRVPVSVCTARIGAVSRAADMDSMVEILYLCSCPTADQCSGATQAVFVS